MSAEQPSAPRALLERAFVQLRELQAELDSTRDALNEPIAIIGLAARMPGGAVDADKFWELLRDGGDAVRPLPSGRWDVPRFEARLRALNPEGPSNIVGGFLSEVTGFDAQFFGISPREAACMDPQQRLILEVSWEALEDAGLDVKLLAGTKTGVFVGVHSQSSDYFLLQVMDPSSVDVYTGTGTAHSVLSGRIAYTFDLRGPAISIDTACSSSLVALHEACVSLRTRSSDLALAGGVNLRLSPAFFFATARMGTGSASGRCRVFDAAADGVVSGEGCGILVLKRLSDALRDNDAIWAVIKGSGINQDGTSAGLAAPNMQAQRAVIADALRQAGVSPEQIGLFETHGTGTALGDPIEVEALTEIVGRGGAARCALGAVKSNLGHLEGAAGIAGVLKAVLSLKHETIPPNLHFKELNPHISLTETPFFVPTQALPWPATDTPRFAGVSAFGWSGTNAHVVISEAPASATKAVPVSSRPASVTASTNAFVLLISAQSEAALRARALQFASFLLEGGENLDLADVCFTAVCRRTHLDWRLAVTGATREGLSDALRVGAQLPVGTGHGSPHRILARPRVVFVFPGQGSQWVGMARELMAAEGVFRRSIEACERAFQPYVNWSLTQQLLGTENPSRFAEIDCIQPCLFAIQVALAALWRSYGVEPDAVVGHSMGEVAAAHVAGKLTLEDASCIICRRSALLRSISGKGAMMLVEMDVETARHAVSEMSTRVSVAASNSQRSTVLSGDRDALEQLQRDFEKAEVFCRWINVDVASHSPHVDSLREDLMHGLNQISPQASNVLLLSTVTGDPCDGTNLNAEYWIRNLREPVLFAQAVRVLHALEHQIFVELSPHPVLIHAVEQTLSEGSQPGYAVGTLRRQQSEYKSFLDAAGLLHAWGARIDWTPAFVGQQAVVRLPSYPWQRECYELQVRGELGDSRSSFAKVAPLSEHPLLGVRIESCVESGSWIWQRKIDLQEFTFLGDHRVEQTCVVPGAVFLDMALAAGRELFGVESLRLDDVMLERMMVLPPHAARTLQCVLTQDNAESGVFCIASREGDVNEQGSWISHVQGRVRTTAPIAATIARDAIAAVCREVRTPQRHYELLASFGVEYGPAFRGVEQVLRRDGEALSEVRLPTVFSDTEGYVLHPALLDSCLQTLSAARKSNDDADGRDTWLPVAVRAIIVHRRPSRSVTCHTVIQSEEHPAATRVEADFALYDAQGELLAEVAGFCAEKLARSPKNGEQVMDWMYELDWESQPLSARAGEAVTGADWLVFVDGLGIGDELVRALREDGHTVTRVLRNGQDAAAEVGTEVIHPSREQDYQRLVSRHALSHVVHLWSLDVAAEQSLSDPIEAQATSSFSVLMLAKALLREQATKPPRLWIVTAGVELCGNPRTSANETDLLNRVAQAPLWGLGRTIAIEHPELLCTRIDLSDVPSQETGALLRELKASSAEDQVALRSEERYVARLERIGATESASKEAPVQAAAGRPFHLEMEATGTIDTMLLRANDPLRPGPSEVVIEVAAAGLNFLDVLLSLRAIPDVSSSASESIRKFGGECSGRVVAIGEGVTGIHLGQEVVAIAPHSMATHVVARADLVLPKPSNLSFLQAASVPIAFTTANWAIHRAARLQPGERVLIHAAAGGVGLAAVELCRKLDVEIFATAGTEQKREYLKSLGVDHVMSSRTLDFADQIREMTGGEGVDVVINSLAGRFIPKSLESLGNYGRFIEIGKRDYYENRALRLRPFLRNLSFALLDLLAIARERPKALREAFQEVVGWIESGHVEIVRQHVFPIADAPKAFSYMAQSLHVGKVVLSLEGAAHTPVAAAMPAISGRGSGELFREDATYLITGGFGGLGMTLARWLVDRGARSLTLVGRHAPDASKQRVIEDLRSRGANVVAVHADVARADQLSRVLQGIKNGKPPLRGIFHCAAVLDDATVLEQNESRFMRVMSPKIAGAWNLHQQTLEDSLDYFALFSSSASMLGSPGQGNYSASNAFLDALALHRHHQGRPALSINWGPWADVGLAAYSGLRGERLAFRGLHGLEPAQGLLALEALLRGVRPQVAVMRLNLRQWSQFFPRSAEQPVLARLPRVTEPSTPSSFKGTLAATPSDQRLELLETHLVEQLAQVLRLPAKRVDRQAPFNSMGVDSLLALEFRNRLEASLGLVLPATLVWAYPTVRVLGPNLLQRLNLSVDAELQEPRKAPPTGRYEPTHQHVVERALAELESMSDQDALRALSEA